LHLKTLIIAKIILIQMNWQGDLGLELFVAKKGYGDGQQYLDSISALLAVSAYGLRERIKVTPLDRLKDERPFLDLIKQNPETPTRLPFLVSLHGCETCAFVGYSGLEEILEILNSPSFAMAGR